MNQTKKKNPLKRLLSMRGMGQVVTVTIGLIVLLVAFALINPNFWSPTNRTNLLRQIAPILIIGIAQSYVLITGNIDLSIGSVVGIITGATVGQGTMDAGNSYEMYAVAASVIGGVSTLGGQGILLGTVVGAAIWGTLQNGLQFAGAPVAIRNIIIGIIVVLSVLMDVVIRTGRRNTKVSD